MTPIQIVSPCVAQVELQNETALDVEVALEDEPELEVIVAADGPGVALR